MCDYSLTNVKSRPAKVGDKLCVHNFGTGTRGFCDADASEPVAVCVLPGTEIAFEENIVEYECVLGVYSPVAKNHPTRVAIFRQIDLDKRYSHHDALELPGGMIVRLTYLMSGQHATVLQLPAAPRTEEEAEAQKRVEFVG